MSSPPSATEPKGRPPHDHPAQTPPLFNVTVPMFNCLSKEPTRLPKPFAAKTEAESSAPRSSSATFLRGSLRSPILLFKISINRHVIPELGLGTDNFKIEKNLEWAVRTIANVDHLIEDGQLEKFFPSWKFFRLLAINLAARTKLLHNSYETIGLKRFDWMIISLVVEEVDDLKQNGSTKQKKYAPHIASWIMDFLLQSQLVTQDNVRDKKNIYDELVPLVNDTSIPKPVRKRLVRAFEPPNENILALSVMFGESETENKLFYLDALLAARSLIGFNNLCQRLATMDLVKSTIEQSPRTKTVVFLYTGHANESYFCVDNQPIDMDELFRAIKCSRFLVVVLDCCYSQALCRKLTTLCEKSEIESGLIISAASDKAYFEQDTVKETELQSYLLNSLFRLNMGLDDATPEEYVEMFSIHGIRVLPPATVNRVHTFRIGEVTLRAKGALEGFTFDEPAVEEHEYFFLNLEVENTFLVLGDLNPNHLPSHLHLKLPFLFQE